MKNADRPWRGAFILPCLFLSACATAEKTPEPSLPTANQALSIITPVIDCEHKAANRYDDGRSTIAALANQVMGVCMAERFKARRAFHLPPIDPDLDLEDYKQAVEIVEFERKSRPAKLKF